MENKLATLICLVAKKSKELQEAVGHDSEGKHTPKEMIAN